LTLLSNSALPSAFRWNSLESLLEEDITNPSVYKELDSPFTLTELNLAVNNMNLNFALRLD